MTDLLLAGKVAIITGAGRGIGRAVAERFASLGAKLVLADNGASIDGKAREPGVAQALAEKIGPAAVAFEQDMASPDAAAGAVALAKEQFGGVDILVNNAAILRDAMVWKGDPADFDAVIRNNLSAAWYLANAATPLMRAQAKEGRTGGRILSMVSSAGFYGNYGVSSYAGAKAGLLGLSRVWALELARAGITANAIMPFAATRVTESLPPVTDLLKDYKARALKLPAKPVAVAAAWLASDLGRNVTGQLIGVRGRDVFLMSQPRPIAHAIAKGTGWDEPSLAHATQSLFNDHYVDLQSDLEAFNIDPLA
ncbi:3-hydroxyacyl-CoA dehydrogenase [Iodidimonas gelatinilytica]|uniref:3-hydroxyacyl-CoA dehydrogenase n=1 Tax=Iodidimonas gelatinilytica TaxID=1236966 RepID=A0A5A7N3Q7_9PROT|nr:SDR family NAD(P)-dependent oxidoreductase [Iodidimonas gelatinilytica]GER01676.1 3-hydroxyacyl-CoA dehydrogenase [Iodidimonas gelatinilytica]